jgi:hypothetical protein
VDSIIRALFDVDPPPRKACCRSTDTQAYDCWISRTTRHLRRMRLIAGISFVISGLAVQKRNWHVLCAMTSRALINVLSQIIFLKEHVMKELKIDELHRNEEMTSSDMARIVGGTTKEPVGKPTHIDAMNGVLTFGDGSKWSMDLNGKLHPL